MTDCIHPVDAALTWFPWFERRVGSVWGGMMLSCGGVCTSQDAIALCRYFSRVGLWSRGVEDPSSVIRMIMIGKMTSCHVSKGAESSMPFVRAMQDERNE